MTLRPILERVESPRALPLSLPCEKAPPYVLDGLVGETARNLATVITVQKDGLDAVPKRTSQPVREGERKAHLLPADDLGGEEIRQGVDEEGLQSLSARLPATANRSGHLDDLMI